jgi:predicted permease
MLNLRLAVRQLVRAPFLAAIAILSLALGIGANAAIFSLFNQLILRRLPVSNPATLVNLASPGPRSGSMSCGGAGDCSGAFSYRLFRDLETSQKVFTGIAAHRSFDANLSARRETLRAEGMFVSGSYFPVLGLTPAAGRLLGPEDDRTDGAAPVAVLSHGFWESNYGRSTVVGESLTVNGQSLTIVGVAPRGFDGTTLGSQPRVFVPITMRPLLTPKDTFDSTNLQNRRSHWAYLFARLRPGITRDAAQASLKGPFQAILSDVEAPLQKAMSPATLERFRARQLLLSDGSRGQSEVYSEARLPLILLLCVTAFVLLIACANITNLLLSRASSRSTEMAVRLSMGASRLQLIRQLLTESAVLALAGGAAGLVVATWTLTLVKSMLPPEASYVTANLDGAMLTFTAAVALGTGLVVGLLPALNATRPDLITALKNQAGQPGGGRRASRVRTSLAVAQVALSMALLVSAGLFTKSLFYVGRIDLGLDADRLMTFAVSPDLNGYTHERSLQLFERIEEELGRLPGVTDVTAARVPLLGRSDSSTNVTVEGYAPGPDKDTGSSLNVVGPGFFQTVGIPLVAGRDFTAGDAANAPKVAIVNEAFARKFNLGPNPVGRRMGVGAANTKPNLDLEIVALARDAKYADAKEPVPPLFFTPYKQADVSRALTFYARTPGDPNALLGAVPAIVKRLDPNLPVERLTTLTQQVQQNVFVDRILTILSSGFAILATLLAGIGLYGVLAYAVSQRTREIGLRMALGATPDRVRNMILRQVGVMTVAGCTMGLAGAAGIGNLAETLLFGISGTDPFIFAAAVVSLGVIALLAGVVPARRASRVEPMRALRYE